MGNPTNRDKPEIVKVEFEEDEEPIPLPQFYGEEDNILAIQTDDNMAILDFDDDIIMVQNKNDIENTTRMMNLLYARENARGLYDLWWKMHDKVKYGDIDESKFNEEGSD